MKRFVMVFFVVTSLTIPAWSHLVTYKNGIGIMQFSSSGSSVTDLNYTFHHRGALVYRHFRWKDLDSEDDEVRNVGQLNLLLHRWNNPNSQGNLYLGWGYGEKETASYQVELDWEDRRHYLAAEHQTLDSRHGIDMEMQKLRAGIAPYVAAAGSLHTWLILQYMKNDVMADKESLTPLIRMFYESALIELGYSFDGEFNFNFMLHF